MSLKRKLFASVAGPVLVLPLLIQPVHAVPRGLDIAAPDAKSQVLRVQQEVVPEEGEGQERPRRRAQEGAGEEGGAQRPRRQRDAEQSTEGERPRRQQRESEQSGERERPRRQQQESQQSGERERPQRRQQESGQSQEGERPRRQQQSEQAPEGERPRRQQRETQQSEENQRPQRRQQQSEQAPEGDGQQRRQQQQTGQSEETERPRRQQQQSEQAPEGDNQQRRQQRDTQQSQENERPRRQQDQNATTGTEGGSGERNQARPSREQTDQDNAATPATREQRAREGQANEQRPRREREAPARAAGGERRQAPAAQGEQPTLPVENGAAVLDSAKEERPDRPRRDGDRPRRDRDRDQQADQQRSAPPRSDAEAQAGRDVSNEQREEWRNRRRELAEERGERLDRRPDFERPRGWDVRGPARGGDRNRGRDGDRDRDDSRVIISIDNQEFVRHNDSRRFYRDGRGPEYERLGDGRVREIVEREDGTRVITVRNRYGEVVQRSRVARGGDEYVLYYAPELLEDDRDRTWRDPGEDLPPMRLTVPVEDYIIDTSSEPDRDYYEFLEQPPVEQVERVYSLDEVRYSARIRDKVPRIDLDTITFETGSSEVPRSQAGSLRKVADAIKKVLDQDPSETFLIEGHTDAVGSDQDNLVLSDERAESVAVVLSDEFAIPPENLTTQGYGEQYLKVKTEAANQENRRVTIRRITPLVKPVASAQ